MQIRSPRTILALSAALALTVSAAGSTAVMAKGPGGGSSECDGDCPAEQPQAQQQLRARDGSGANDVTEPQRTRARDASSTSQQTSTRANAGGGGKVQARAADEGKGGGRNANQRASRATGQDTDGQGRNARQGAGNGPNEDGERGPGTCDECDVEMGTLTDEQAAGVVFMANEEKLAHDLYSAFAEMYGVPIFSNIAASEARHQQAVTTVLERYGLEDTAIDLPAGEFSDPLIATLYDQLIEQGSASLEEAIAVGVLIEETDIADLESRIADLSQTSSDGSTVDAATLDEDAAEAGAPDVVEAGAPDVVEMYSHLLAGSRNHLSAFQGWQ